MPRLRHAAFAAIALACLCSTAPAFAEMREPVTARLSYADLNLATAKGRVTLAQRLHRVARNACASDARDLSGFADSARCRHEMEQSGAQQIAALIHQHDDVRLAAADPR